MKGMDLQQEQAAKKKIASFFCPLCRLPTEVAQIKGDLSSSNDFIEGEKIPVYPLYCLSWGFAVKKHCDHDNSYEGKHSLGLAYSLEVHFITIMARSMAAYK